MKQFFSAAVISAFVISSMGSCAQDNRPSPPATTTGKAGNTNITIVYSQPAVKGRKVWGDLVPYGKVWRTGANEATTFEVDGDVKVEGQALPKGKYALFTIPGETEWTVIFSKNVSQWGSFRYKQEEDVLRVKAKPGKAPEMTERMTFMVSAGKVTLRWENVEVSFNVQ